jgi:hypothetical protein
MAPTIGRKKTKSTGNLQVFFIPTKAQFCETRIHVRTVEEVILPGQVSARRRELEKHLYAQQQVH